MTTNKLKVVLVLKSGGDFNQSHVYRLYEQIEKHLSIPHEVICLTDFLQLERKCYSNLFVLNLLDKLPGWWSKIEIFRSFSNIIYFDLDTTILGNIDFLAENSPTFMALKSKHRHMGSGIMRWQGDLSQLYKYFIKNKEANIKYYAWDQEYINSWLVSGGYIITHIQTTFPGKVISYKNDYLPIIKGRVLPDFLSVPEERPEKPSIIYFHGKPRPWEVPEIT